MKLERVFIGLGSNIGDALEMFNKACDGISSFSKINARSSLYITKPYGYEDQADFTNAVLEISSDETPDNILVLLQGIEKKVGKKVIHENGPRCIDLDLLFYGNKIQATVDLEVPHPHAHKRDFVLLPMCDIAADFIHPVQKKSMKELLDGLDTHYYTGKTISWDL